MTSKDDEIVEIDEVTGIRYRKGEHGLLYPVFDDDEDQLSLMAKINQYGQARRVYLEENYPFKYAQLCADFSITQYLADISEEASNRVKELIDNLLIRNPAPPQGTMKWVQHMNSMKKSAEDIIYEELIYAE